MRRLGVAAAMAGTILSSAGLATAARAQSDVPTRVGKLEAEMRAVQRKVFPGGSGQYLQPEVSEARSPAEIPGTPSSSAMVDLSSRVTSLEGQMAKLTDQTEQNAYKLRQLQDLFDAYRRSTDAKLAGIGTAGAPVGGTDAAPLGTTDTPARDAPPPPSRKPPIRTPARPTRDTLDIENCSQGGKACICP